MSGQTVKVRCHLKDKSGSRCGNRLASIVRSEGEIFVLFESGTAAIASENWRAFRSEWDRSRPPDWSESDEKDFKRSMKGQIEKAFDTYFGSPIRVETQAILLPRRCKNHPELNKTPNFALAHSGELKQSSGNGQTLELGHQSDPEGRIELLIRYLVHGPCTQREIQELVTPDDDLWT